MKGKGDNTFVDYVAVYLVAILGQINIFRFDCHLFIPVLLEATQRYDDEMRYIKSIRAGMREEFSGISDIPRFCLWT
jgi:hypothetical protein